MDKNVFTKAQHESNNITYLIGLSNAQLFEQPPEIHTGIESVTIDYHNAVHITVPRNVHNFVTELNDMYHNRLRGSIKVCSNHKVFDIIISKY